MSSGESSEAERDRLILSTYESELKRFLVKEWWKSFGHQALQGLAAMNQESAMFRLANEVSYKEEPDKP